MIDFHAHVLPRCDHGSDGIETSLRQLQLAREAGVTTLIATPHFYPDHDSFEALLQRRSRTYQELMERHSGLPEVLTGCEVHLCPGLDHIEGLERACVRGTRLLLIEMPVSYWSSSLEETLVRLHDDRRFTVVLAHIDRYDPKRIERLLPYGFLAQINAESVLKIFGRKRLLQWIDRGNVVALGSDIHGTVPGYEPFTKAIRILKERADTIFERTGHLLEDNRV